MPNASVEQYATPAGIAAELVLFAYGRGDIAGRSVLDLGCGNGVLAIAASYLGASRVLGVDVDANAIEIARKNASRLAVDIEWRAADVRAVREKVDTVLMNPPFGAQTRHADRPFFETALACADVVYTFLNAKSESFVRDAIETRGGTISDRLAYAFPVPRTFAFHRDDERSVEVVLFRIEVAKG